MKLSRIAIAGFAISLIAACGASPGAPTAARTAVPVPTQAPGAATPAPTSPPVGATPGPVAADVCSLLTPADLDAATGKTYVAGTLDSVGQCLWNVEGASGNTGSLIVGAIQANELSFIKSAFGAGGSDVSLAGRHPAFYNPTEGLGSLWVDLGNGSLLVLSVPTSGDLDPSYERILVQLALAALDKM